MSSSSDAANDIDRTVTPAQEIPVRRQKRTFTTDSISDHWIEGHRSTLLELKDGTRVVSPRTMYFVDDMLNQCNTALSQPWKTEYFEELKEELQSDVSFLEARLENDDKYAKELESFTALGTENMLLRYGDYCAEGCNTIRSMAMGDDKKLFRGKTWKEILEGLECELKDLKEYEACGKLGVTPKTPVYNFIRTISLLWKGFGCSELIAMIRFYVDRNGRAHNGLNEHIQKRSWNSVALLCRRDYHNINIYYPQLKDKGKVELLQGVIESCQKKFFDWIDEECDDGEWSIISWKLRDEVAAEDVKIHAAKEKAKEDAALAAEMKSLASREEGTEPLTEVQMAKLKEAQSAYRALIKDRNAIEAQFKKQKLEFVEKRVDSEKDIAMAKTRLEKAAKGEE